MHLRFFWLVVGVVAAVPGGAAGQGLPSVAPEEVGLSSARLERLDRVIQGYVDRGEVAGAVALVARRGGQAHLNAYGHADVGDRTAMEPSTIFRIASMTKPVTSVAVMMLYEEGHFRLNDPIGQYLPELGSLEVLEVIDAAHGSYREVPSDRAVTIRHLLTHTSGISYRFLGSPLVGPGPEQRILSGLYAEADVADGLVEHSGTLEGLIEKLSELPLLNQPGEAFTYGLNHDVLGRLVEVVSGKSYDEFLRTRIFEPLGMIDTGFYVPPSKADRLASVYSPGSGGSLTELEGSTGDDLLQYSATYSTDAERTYFPGGAGLTSTVQDYARFAQMLLNGGELDGVRLLSPLTVELMVRDHIGDAPSSGLVVPGSGGFGLGFAVAAAPNTVGDFQEGSEGSFRWSGFFNTTFWVDPEEELLGVLMTQLFPNSTDIQPQFRIMTYQAVVQH